MSSRKRARASIKVNKVPTNQRSRFVTSANFLMSNKNRRYQAWISAKSTSASLRTYLSMTSSARISMRSKMLQTQPEISKDCFSRTFGDILWISKTEILRRLKKNKNWWLILQCKSPKISLTISMSQGSKSLKIKLSYSKTLRIWAIENLRPKCGKFQNWNMIKWNWLPRIDNLRKWPLRDAKLWKSFQRTMSWTRSSMLK